MDICVIVNTSGDNFSNMNLYLYKTSYDNIYNHVS